MNLILYNNPDDKRKVNKSITQVGNTITTFEFKDDTSLMNPTIILKDGLSVLSNDVNYLYVDTVNRYYFINDITFSQQHILLSCSVDVLMSFREEILAQTAILKRQENIMSGYLNDGELVSNQYNNTVLKAFTNPFKKALEFIIVVGG